MIALRRGIVKFQDDTIMYCGWCSMSDIPITKIVHNLVELNNELEMDYEPCNCASGYDVEVYVDDTRTYYNAKVCNHKHIVIDLSNISNQKITDDRDWAHKLTFKAADFVFWCKRNGIEEPVPTYAINVYLESKDERHIDDGYLKWCVEQKLLPNDTETNIKWNNITFDGDVLVVHTDKVAADKPILNKEIIGEKHIQLSTHTPDRKYREL